MNPPFRTILVSLVVVAAGCEQLLEIRDPRGYDEISTDAEPAGDDASGNDAAAIDGPPGTNACAPLPSFGPVTRYGAANAIALAVGDVNRDGFKDVVVVTRANKFTGEVLIFEGNQNGVLGASRPLRPGSATAATEALIADVDGDGSMDVMTFGLQGLSPVDTVVVHRQSLAAPGTFLAAQSFSVPGLRGVVAGNLDGNARSDLIIQSGANDTFPYIASTVTAGVFTRGARIETDALVAHVMDIDQDGLDDISFARMAGGLGLAFNDHATSPGTFTLAAVGAGEIENASFGHYTGSATRQDVVTFASFSSMGVLYAQTAPRVFVERSPMATNRIGRRFTASGGGMKTLDLNGDGRDDVVGTATAAIQCPTVGTFFPAFLAQTEVTYPRPPGQPSLFEKFVLADINGNGKPDLIDLPDPGPNEVLEIWLQ